MMKRILPYPILAVGLVTMWLLLTSYTLGSLVLALIVGIGATHALKALGEVSPRIGRWLAIPQLFFIVLYDIIRSNIAVTGLILAGRRDQRRSSFLVIPLRLRNPSALAILAIIVTSTPGTAWIEFNSARGELILHVFDLVEDADWVHLIATRYERLLLEMFE